MRFRMPMIEIVSPILFLLTACTSAYSVNPANDLSAPISTGDRPRVTHNNQCCTSPSIGVAESLTRDSLVLQPEMGHQRFAIPRSSITQIERWNPGQTHKLAGMGFGFLIGAATGALIGYSAGCSHCDGDMRPLDAAAGFILGGGGGALAGIVFGAGRRGYWETVAH